MQYDIKTGPFYTHLTTSITTVAEGIDFFYRDSLHTPSNRFYDFHVQLETPNSLRRWVRPQVQFLFDGKSPFKPLPLSQAFPMFEWGLNWCISGYCHSYLMVHAAVVERDGTLVIMPGLPGAGKSTLCAALINRGWRLFSDELALVSMSDGKLTPLARPVSLKNQSIDIIRNFAPNAEIGPVVFDTGKGTVAHMKPPGQSVEYFYKDAEATHIIFPNFQLEGECEFLKKAKTYAFMDIAKNTFNYNLLGKKGFQMLGRLIEKCSCYELFYTHLDDAIEILDGLDV